MRPQGCVKPGIVILMGSVIPSSVRHLSRVKQSSMRPQGSVKPGSVILMGSVIPSSVRPMGSVIQWRSKHI